MTQLKKEDNKFTQACREGDLDKVKEFIQNGQDPRVNDNIALWHASCYGNLDIVRYLCEKFPPDIFGGVRPRESMINVAFQNNHSEIAEYLRPLIKEDLKDFTKCNCCINNPEYHKSILGSIKIWISNSKEYNALGQMTPEWMFLSACEIGCVKAVKILCNNITFDSNIKNKGLYNACRKGNVRVMEELCRRFPFGTRTGVDIIGAFNISRNFELDICGKIKEEMTIRLYRILQKCRELEKQKRNEFEKSMNDIKDALDGGDTDTLKSISSSLDTIAEFVKNDYELY